MITPIAKTPYIAPASRPFEGVNFCGLKGSKDKSMFVFDLDGTLAGASVGQIDYILDKAQACNSDIVYATGRTYKEFLNLQNKLHAQGKYLPTPDYLISNNGNFLHENIGGQLTENLEYQDFLQNKTHYDRNIVTRTVKNISKSPQYQYSTEELASLENLEEVKTADSEFYNSKISYYEWNPSCNMAEYFLADDVDLKKLEGELTEALSKYGIKTKFKENRYPKPIMDACKQSILLQSNSLRRAKDGSMTALFLSAADKADGIEFLRRKNEIRYNEILMAGNDDNDISMAKLTERGSKFICMGDGSTRLIEYCKSLGENIFLGFQKGADAIVQGIGYFTK